MSYGQGNGEGFLRGRRIAVFLDDGSLFGDEVGHSHGVNAQSKLEIHGLPHVPGKWQENPLESEDYSKKWPSLPGASEFRGNSCFWSSAASRSRPGASKSRFALADSQWPSLDSQGGQGSFLGEISGVLERNPFASGIRDERGHIPGTKGPTQQQSHQQLGRGREREELGDGGDRFLLEGRIESGGSKGWMRLPPIFMPSSPSSLSSSQQQQKRCRQAAFAESTSPSSSSSSPEEESNAFRNASSKATTAAASSSSYLPPVYLMLNNDFVVISPLKENLLLTLALAGHKRHATLPSFDAAASAPSELFEEHESLPPEVAAAAAAVVGDAKRRQVFVGRFEAFSSFVKFGLGRDALRVATESNAGGTSTISESLSVEYFVRKFKASDVVTEMEVEYCAMNWKKVDYICNLYGQRVGVSVTRAMSYPNPEDFSPQMAYRLLYKKLFGLVVARHGVTERHSFSQCVLHVWCETTTTAKLLQAQYKEVSEELDITDDVIMVLTVAEGWHARPIFYESCLVRDC